MFTFVFVFLLFLFFFLFFLFCQDLYEKLLCIVDTAFLLKIKFYLSIYLYLFTLWLVSCSHKLLSPGLLRDCFFGCALFSMLVLAYVVHCPSVINASTTLYV